MAEEASGEEKPITFHIKTAGDAKYTVTVPLSMTVSSLKELLSTEQYAGLAPERQRLIYSGRVLKDADTLVTYKVKEGNTVHMVKTAESNTRNQPGAAPAGNAQSSSGAASAPQVPSMAAGTGANNLLAGLTGARFAGLAQLPNQSMFGPDGGMGAPDPEEAIRRLEDPETQRQLNEALSNPDVLNEMIRQNPMLANMPPGYREMLQPMIRQMMTNPEMMRQSLRAQRAMAGGGFGGGGGPGSGFAAPGGVDGGEGSNTQAGEGGTQGGQQAGQNAQNNPFAVMFGGGAPGAGGAGADNPFLSLLNPGMFGGAPGQGGEGSREGASPPANPFGGNPFANPMAQNMMRNMMADPELMQRIMQSMYGPPPQQGAGQGAGQGDGQARSGAAAGEGSSGTEGQTQGQTPGQGQAAANPFAALFGGMPGGAAGNPFAAFGGGGGDMGMFGQPSGPPDNRPPEERYADQLRQLNDMGFYDFDRNVEALRRSGGSVQGAVNHLLGG